MYYKVIMFVFEDILEMSLEDGMAECVVGAGHIKPEQSTPLVSTYCTICTTVH
jgi:hypothetical protein